MNPGGWLETCIFACDKLSHHAFQWAYSKGVDQTAQAGLQLFCGHETKLGFMTFLVTVMAILKY